MATNIERIREIQQKRIAAFANFGVTARPGGSGVAGSIELSATQAQLLLLAIERKDKTIAELMRKDQPDA